MKKKYLSPAVVVMNVETESLMAASGPDNTIEVGMDNEGSYGGSFHAKGHTSVWDFDEDDD